MGLDDLWSIASKGRWWIVGSAVVIDPAVESSCSKTDVIQKSEFSDRLLKLARKNHMNTDLRRNIFCIVVSSEVNILTKVIAFW